MSTWRAAVRDLGPPEIVRGCGRGCGSVARRPPWSRCSRGRGVPARSRGRTRRAVTAKLISIPAGVEFALLRNDRIAPDFPAAVSHPAGPRRVLARTREPIRSPVKIAGSNGAWSECPSSNFVHPAAAASGPAEFSEAGRPDHRRSLPRDSTTGRSGRAASGCSTSELPRTRGDSGDRGRVPQGRGGGWKVPSVPVSHPPDPGARGSGAAGIGRSDQQKQLIRYALRATATPPLVVSSDTAVFGFGD